MRSVIKRAQVQVDEAAAPRPRAAGAAPERACASPARVRLVRIDAELQALELTCACGAVSLIEIQCEKKP